MNKEKINTLVKSKILRIRQKDTEKVKSLIKSAETNVKIVKNITLDEESATVIFREIYESIRQLGDARWWMLGYEPSNHEISLEILEELEIKEKVKLFLLERFKRIRHDANYRGFKVSIAQAKEIIDFWDSCGREIIQIISKGL